ncbi:hypothetical protein K501DRAFT_246569 [Backusella circina FSU 941]|nr:hypothetical protein K501DRAFT_246569 [Backusella circina FSU 941]
MDSKLYSKLDLLADNTLPIIFERNKLKELKLNVDKYEGNVEKNMNQLRDGLKTLERQLSEEEQSGARDTKQEEDRLIRLQVKIDKLDALLGNQNDATARELLLGNSKGKSVKFTVIDMNTSHLENNQILQLQQRVMNDQDQDLDALSTSIGRQRELGLQINDELDVHSRLIDETETMVDRTQQRLDQAKKKLDYVSRRVKDNKSICIIIALVLIFFILLGLFN